MRVEGGGGGKWPTKFERVNLVRGLLDGVPYGFISITMVLMPVCMQAFLNLEAAGSGTNVTLFFICSLYSLVSTIFSYHPNLLRWSGAAVPERAGPALATGHLPIIRPPPLRLCDWPGDLPIRAHPLGHGFPDIPRLWPHSGPGCRLCQGVFSLFILPTIAVV